MVESRYPGYPIIHYKKMYHREAVWFLKENGSNPIVGWAIYFTQYINDYSQLVDSNKEGLKRQT